MPESVVTVNLEADYPTVEEARQCSAGDAQLGLYMSLKFAVQR